MRSGVIEDVDLDFRGRGRSVMKSRGDQKEKSGGFRGDRNCHNVLGEIVWKSEMTGFRGRSQGRSQGVSVEMIDHFWMKFREKTI